MKATFKLYNTLTRQVEDFQPLTDGEVLIYTCGPTVYGNQHIGNYRTFIFEDVLVKSLRRFGYQVKRAMNITDVGHLTNDDDNGEDKMTIGAKRDGLSAWEVAKKYEANFLADLERLNLEKPAILVRATDTIAEQIAMIQQLEQKGYTYKTSDGIYFDSAKWPEYGKLAKLDPAGLEAGKRVEMGEKRLLTDFALWKLSKPEQKRDMEWQSPWGTGFPGWHIECSAIVEKTLGQTIDIHCGGVDHIPVHHTNEIAQSEAAHGQPLANFWLHADFLLMEGGKMAKSLGNLYTLADLSDNQIEPLAFRLMTYSANYRSKLNFSWEGLQAAQKSLRRLRLAYAASDKGTETNLEPYLDDFQAALADDLNLPAALAVVWQALEAPLTHAARQEFLNQVDQVLSLSLSKPVEELEMPDQVKAWIAERDAARAAQDWTKADQLRHQITAAGFEVHDR